MHTTATITLRASVSRRLVTATLAGRFEVSSEDSEYGPSESAHASVETVTIEGVTLNLSDDEDGEWDLFAAAYELDGVSTEYSPFCKALDAHLLAEGTPVHESYDDAFAHDLLRTLFA